MPRPIVLLVEDEFLIRFVLNEALSEQGFDVIEAADGAEALAALQGGPAPALLVTDMLLPGGLNGADVARAARLAAPGLPAIFMTGDPDSALRAGAGPQDAVIAKPCLPSEVCAIAQQLTRR